MASSHNYLDPETLSELKDLTVRASTIVDGLVTGMHRSPFKGYSVEFAQHREYAPGDDIRHVDWKVFARTDKLHLKQYEDETNLCCWFLVDQSQSMQFQGPEAVWSKYDFACCLAVAFAWLVLNQRDAVASALFADELTSIGKPSDRQESLTQLIAMLEDSDCPESTSFEKSLGAFAVENSKRGIVVVISDCFDEFESIAAGLESIRRRDHQVVLIQVVDPTELTLDLDQAMELRGLESGPTTLVDPVSLQSDYQKVVEDQTRLLSGFCEKQSILFEQVTSDTNLSSALTRIITRLSGANVVKR